MGSADVVCVKSGIESVGLDVETEDVDELYQRAISEACHAIYIISLIVAVGKIDMLVLPV